MSGGSRAASCVSPGSAVSRSTAPALETANNVQQELNPVAEIGGSSGSGQVVAQPSPVVRIAPPPDEKADVVEDSEPSNLRAMRAPRDPTQQEIEEHEAAGHSPYRQWCRACVAGAGRRDRHIRQKQEEEKAVPTLSLDYAFMGGPTADGAGRAVDMPILVTKCSADRWVTSDPVPAKGTSIHAYGARCLAEAIVQTGFPKLILKSDDEAAIKELKREAVKLAREEVNVEVVMEESMDYVSETNGPVEQAVRQIEDKIRTLKFAMEEMHGTKVDSDAPVLKWAVRYAGQIMSRAHRYEADGRTSYELRKGKPYRRALPIFGEKVSAMTLGKRRMKSEYRCFEAIFLGLVARSDMLIVGNKDGCFRVACIKRLAPSQRRDADMLLGVVGVPWRPKPRGEPGAEVPLRVSAEPVVEEEELPKVVKPTVPDVSGRQVYIRRHKELAKYAFTPECPGCDAARAGVRAVGHSAECRERITQRMEEDDEGRVRLTEAFLRTAPSGSADSPAPSAGPQPAARVAPPPVQPRQCSTAAAAAAEPAGTEAVVRVAPPPPAGTSSGSAGCSATAAAQRTKTKAPPASAGSPAGQEQPNKKSRTEDEDEVMMVIAEAHADEDAIDWSEPNDVEAQYYDDISGALLDPQLVKEARGEEIQFVKDFGVYVKVPAAQAVGKTKVSIKWVDINKGDAKHPEYRSRLVGRELKKWDPFMSGTFAATPPTESLRFMLSNFMTMRFKTRQRKQLTLGVLDVSRAHFHPPAEREVYIDLPAEDAEPGMVGLLKKTIYGTRDAAAQWEKFYGDVFEAAGFKTGLFSPCLFHNPERDVSVWVHGDDMLLLGERAEVDRLEQELRKHMLLKRRALLGWRPDEDKSISVLNRIIELHESYDGGGRALTYEPDPRHVEIAVKAMGLDSASAKSVGTPAIKSQDFLDDTPLEREEVTTFRSVCMRLSFLAADWPHLLYPTKEAARKMQAPTRGAFARLKRIVRYLKGAPRCVQVFKEQHEVSELLMMTDSDFAGCQETRKSTSSCFLWRGSHMIRATSSTQGIQGLSSGESEFMALVRGCSILLGAGAMAKDLGYEFALRAGTDSSAAKGVAGRRGVGKIRHLHTPLLWLQTKTRNGDIKISKLGTTTNWSDLATKVHDQKRMHECLKACGFEVKVGRSKLALGAAL